MNRASWGMIVAMVVGGGVSMARADSRIDCACNDSCSMMTAGAVCYSPGTPGVAPFCCPFSSGCPSDPGPGIPCVDAGPPSVDAGPPRIDAGPPGVDAGRPDVDAGHPGVDAGEAPPDAGPSRADAGHAEVDAGTHVDAGSAPHDAGTSTTDGGGEGDAGSSVADAGASRTDAGTARTDAGTTETGGDSGGCSCGVAGVSSSRTPASALAWLVGLGAVIARRRARRRAAR